MAIPIRSLWNTRDTRSFLLYDDCIEFLSMVAVQSVEITSRFGAEWQCPMCGTPNKSTAKCTGCNAPRKGLLTRGIALVEGFLPAALMLNRLSDGFQIDVCYRDCDRPDEYDEQGVIVTLRDCRVLRKWMPHLESLSYDEYEPVTLCLEIGCDVVLKESIYD